MIAFHVGGAAAIELAGEIDIRSAAGIANEVAAALDAGPCELSLGMAAVTFIDSTGIGALVAARNACLARGIPMVVANPSQQVMRMLQLTGLHQVMAVRPAAGY